MLFCCLWRNAETSRHEHFIVISRYQQTLPLSTSDKCHNLSWSGGAVLITPRQSQHWQQSIDSILCPPHLHLMPPIGRPRRNIVMLFNVEKLQWLGYPKVKKIWRYVYSFWQNPRTWQTDTQTPYNSIGHIYVAKIIRNQWNNVPDRLLSRLSARHVWECVVTSRNSSWIANDVQLFVTCQHHAIQQWTGFELNGMVINNSAAFHVQICALKTGNFRQIWYQISGCLTVDFQLLCPQNSYDVTQMPRFKLKSILMVEWVASWQQCSLFQKSRTQHQRPWMRAHIGHCYVMCITCKEWKL